MVKSLVCVKIGSKVIHSVLENDNENEIISSLKMDRNNFISKIFLSQSFVSIKEIKDSNFLFNDFFDSSNRRIDDYSDVKILMEDGNFHYKYYIVDPIERTLSIHDRLNIKNISLK